MDERANLFERAIHNWPDSPIAVHWRMWWQGVTPDLASSFYLNTPFARWVQTVQGAAALLFMSFILVAIGLWLKNALEHSPVQATTAFAPEAVLLDKR